MRELETHGETVEQSSVGHRTAINVTGVSVDEVHRGDELLAEADFPVTLSIVAGSAAVQQCSDCEVSGDRSVAHCSDIDIRSNHRSS